MIRKMVVLVRVETGCLYRVAKGQGRRRAISMSKTRKITARRKNRIEKGRRALFLGSNPHSNGEAFSRLRAEREDRRVVRAIIRVENRSAIEVLFNE